MKKKDKHIQNASEYAIRCFKLFTERSIAQIQDTTKCAYKHTKILLESRRF